MQIEGKIDIEKPNYGRKLFVVEGNQATWSKRRIVFVDMQRASTVVQWDDDSFLKRNPSFAAECFDILLRVAKQCDVRISLELVDFTSDTSCDISILKRYIKSLFDREDLFSL